MTHHQRQPNFEASCGTEIVRESKLRIRRMWSACGEVMDRFNNDIMPDIEALLENSDPAYADYFFSVVMVGVRKASAKPKVLVSCINRDVRDDVLKLIRASHIPVTYPEFGLGSSGVPLHEPLPSGPMGSKGKGIATSEEDHTMLSSTSTSGHSQYSQGGMIVLASHHDPSVGRRLFVPSSSGEPFRYATGGVVIRVGDSYYQKTVGHFEEPMRPLLQQQWSQEDLDYLRFDDDSDEEDDDALQLDYDTTSRGSLTPPPDEDLSQGASYDENSEAGSSIGTAGPSNRRGRSRSSPDYSAGGTSAIHAYSHVHDSTRESFGLKHIGRLQHNSRFSHKAGLDYALVLLERPFSIEKTNQICMDTTTNLHIRVRRVGSIPIVERDIVTVTASGGVTHGKLRPSAIYLRNAHQASLQKLFVVQLSTVILDGDCGADVVDEETGNLYGHIVRGCRGTQIAYIVSAKDVFQDLHDRLSIRPAIVCPHHIKEHVPVLYDNTPRIQQTVARKGTESREFDDSSYDRRTSDRLRPGLPITARSSSPTPTALSSDPVSTVDAISEFLKDYSISASDRHTSMIGESYGSPFPALPTIAYSRPRFPIPALAPAPAPASAPRRWGADTVSTVPSMTFDVGEYEKGAQTASSMVSSSIASSSIVPSSVVPSSVGTSFPTGMSGDGTYILPCEFVGYGSCNEFFGPPERDQWIDHIIVDHLQDRLPNKCNCWYCDDFDFDAQRDELDKNTSFRNRLEHIHSHIQHEGRGIADIRPDFDFLAHLHKLNLISQTVYETAQAWREGPISRVTGIFPHDFIPEEQIQRHEQNQRVIVQEPREIWRRYRAMKSRYGDMKTAKGQPRTSREKDQDG